MAREVVVLTHSWCDVCLRENDERVNSTWSDTVTLGKLTRDLDLCENHRDKLIGELPDILRRVGQKPDHSSVPARSAATDAACPLCDRSSANRAALSAHMRHVHHIGLREYGLHGAPAGGLVCPECGSRDYTDPRGLASHRRSKHGVAGTARSAS